MTLLLLLSFLASIVALSWAIMFLMENYKVKLAWIISLIIGSLAITNMIWTSNAYTEHTYSTVCHDMGGEMAYDRCWINTETDTTVEA